MLHEIITSPLYLFLKGIMPSGFDYQVVNFVGAYFLLRFTVMKHFKLIEGKFDTLNKAVKEGFKNNDDIILEIKSVQSKTIARVEFLESLKQRS